MRIVDTHLHLIYLDQFTYPWLDGAPPLNRQWDAPTLLRRSRQARHRSGAPHGGRRRRAARSRTRRASCSASTRASSAPSPAPARSTSTFPQHLERIAAEPARQGHPPPAAVRPRRPLGRRRLPRQYPPPRRRIGLTFDICVRAAPARRRARRSPPPAPTCSSSSTIAATRRSPSGDIAQLARRHRRARRVAQRRRQDLRHRQPRPARLDRRRPAPGGRAHDRKLRLGPRRLGLRPPGADRSTAR